MITLGAIMVASTVAGSLGGSYLGNKIADWAHNLEDFYNSSKSVTANESVAARKETK